MASNKPRLHFNEINNYKHVKAINSAQGDTVQTAKISTKAYRDTYHPEKSEVREIEINDLRTFIERLNIMRVINFVYKLETDTRNQEQSQIRLNSISLKYELKREGKIMPLKYGINIPASNAQSIIDKTDKTREGIKTWQQLFGGASLGFGAQSDALRTDYGSAMQEAYKTNLNQRSDIVASGLSQGYQNELVGMNMKDLTETYNKFLSGYSSDLGKVQKSYTEEVGTINEALTGRARIYLLCIIRHMIILVKNYMVQNVILAEHK